MRIAVCLLFVYGLYALPNKKMLYFAVEHPKIVYVDTEYIEFARIYSRRYNRQDPVYYFRLQIHFNYPTGNNMTVSFFFYEFLSNTYKRSFVEIHTKVCDMIAKEPVFGNTVKKALQKSGHDTCPLQGSFDLDNCTINTAPLMNFPFQKGRIYVNLTVTSTHKTIGQAYVDFQIKEMTLTKKN